MKKVIVAILAIASMCAAQTNLISLGATRMSGVNLQTGTSYTVLVTDRGKLVNFSNASAQAVTLPQATGNFTTGFFFLAGSKGAGTVTITPTTSTIDGQSSMTLTQYQGVFIVSDGTNWYTDRGVGSTFTGTVTTTGSPASGNLTKFSGATSITNGDLSGDVTTSSTLATTVAKIQGTTVSGTTGGTNVVFSASPTIVTPTIASFANANHDHTNSAGGGQLTDSALSAAVTVPKGGTGATTLTAHGPLVGEGTSPVVASSPGVSGNCYISNGASADPTFQTCANAAISAPYFRSMVKNGPREDLYIAHGASGGVDVLGQAVTASTISRSFGDSTNPTYSQITTSTVNQNTVTWITNKVYNQGHNLHLTARARFSATTNVRQFIGWSDSTAITDTNNGLNVIGFSYSTLRGDTNWQCATNNTNATEADAASSAIPPDANWHTFEIIATDATPAYDFYIDGVHACAQSTTKIPASNTLLEFAAVVICQSCAAANNVRISMYSNSMDW